MLAGEAIQFGYGVLDCFTQSTLTHYPGLPKGWDQGKSNLNLVCPLSVAFASSFTSFTIQARTDKNASQCIKLVVMTCILLNKKNFFSSLFLQCFYWQILKKPLFSIFSQLLSLPVAISVLFDFGIFWPGTHPNFNSMNLFSNGTAFNYSNGNMWCFIKK